MRKLCNITLNAIWAGIAISMGSLIYLNQPNLIGALMFSIGLILIVSFHLKLYTGVIGYVSNRESLFYALFILLMNAIGCLIMIFFPTDQAIQFMATKLNQPMVVIFTKAFFCGILILSAIEFNKKNQIGLLILAVGAFIMMGAEHSIADICFLISARNFSLQAISFILLVAFGNAIGSLSFYQIIKNNERSN